MISLEEMARQIADTLYNCPLKSTPNGPARMSEENARRFVLGYLTQAYNLGNGFVQKCDMPDLFKIFEQNCKDKVYEAFKLPDYRDHPNLIRARARKILEEMPEELKEVCDELSKNGLD